MKLNEEFVVRFGKINGRQKALNVGPILHDNKPVIMES